MELQVLVHGVDVVEDVPGDPWDNAHQLAVVEAPLHQSETRGRSVGRAAEGYRHTPNYRHTLTSMVWVFPEDV